MLPGSAFGTLQEMSRPLFSLGFLLLLLLVSFPGEVRAEGFEGELQSAEAFYDSGRYQDAIKILKGILREDPEVARAHFLYGEIYREAKQPARAKRFYLKAVELDPENRKASKNLVEILQAEARTGGLGVYEKIVRSGVYLPPLVAAMARSYASRGSSRKVFALTKKFREALEADRVPLGFPREGAEVLYVAAQMAYKGRDLAKARSFLIRARNLSSQVEGLGELDRRIRDELKKRATPAKLEGDRLARSGDYEAALVEYRKALDIYQDWGPVESNVLAVHSLVEAEKLYREAEQLAAKGRTTVAMGKLILGLSKPVENDDLRLRNQEILARLESKRSELEASVKARKAAERKREEDFDSAFVAAEAAARSEEWTEAARHYREAVRYQPDNERAIRKLEEAEEKAAIQSTVEEGVQSFRKKKYRQALAAFQAVEEQVSADPKLLRYLALSHFYLEQYDKAEPLADQALSDSPSNKEMLYILGVIHDGKAQSGESRPDTAIKYLERIERQDEMYLDVAERLSRLRWQRDRTVTIALALGAVIWGVVMIWLKYRPTIRKNRFLGRIESYSRREKWEALAALEQEAKDTPLDKVQDLAVCTALAQAFYHTRNWQKAISWCGLALERNRENPALVQLMGRIYFDARIISQDVVKYLVALSETEPDNVELLRFIGEFCLDKQLVNDQTMPILRNLAMSMPQNDRLRKMLIRGYLRNKDTSARALALYRVELKQCPDRVDLRYYVAADTFKSGRTEEAIQHCETILNQKLNHPQTHDLLRKCYEKIGKLDELARIYQGILENDPYNPAVQDSLKKILNPG